jgi:amino acid permease
MDLMTVISTVTFAFCNQFNVPQVYEEMRNKVDVGYVAYTSTSIVTLIYIITAVAGYVCYGFEIDKDILLNFGPLVQAGNIVIYAGICAVTLSVSVCHLLNNFPMRLSVMYFLPSSMQENGLVKKGVPLFTAISSILIACTYANLSIFLGLVGSLTGSIICYIVPAMFSIRVDQLTDDDAEKLPLVGSESRPSIGPIFTCANIAKYPMESAMIALGVVLGIVGTFCEFYSCFTM